MNQRIILLKPHQILRIFMQTPDQLVHLQISLPIVIAQIIYRQVYGCRFSHQTLTG